jgi:26S proteasome regulatory subunit N2
LGLAACGSHEEGAYAKLRQALYDRDEAVSGEAAGVGMGLVMAASLDEPVFQEMQQYLKDTQHDKIQRGLRTGIALLAYGTTPPWRGRLRLISTQ